jgi:hypothetical protein
VTDLGTSLCAVPAAERRSGRATSQPSWSSDASSPAGSRRPPTSAFVDDSVSSRTPRRTSPASGCHRSPRGRPRHPSPAPSGPCRRAGVPLPADKPSRELRLGFDGHGRLLEIVVLLLDDDTELVIPGTPEVPADRRRDPAPCRRGRDRLRPGSAAPHAAVDPSDPQQPESKPTTPTAAKHPRRPPRLAPECLTRQTVPRSAASFRREGPTSLGPCRSCRGEIPATRETSTVNLELAPIALATVGLPLPLG